MPDTTNKEIKEMTSDSNQNFHPKDFTNMADQGDSTTHSTSTTASKELSEDNDDTIYDNMIFPS